MSEGDIIFSYSFNREETMGLAAVVRKQRLPPELSKFSKVLQDALMRNISLDEAEALFNG
ncbi:MAG: hypothetical protein LBR23_00820 [Spirochaetaceae bacterium]|jgi:hypothetical protein|nr:hypothetical protein [Spirochaetaceae bacterium]